MPNEVKVSYAKTLITIAGLFLCLWYASTQTDIIERIDQVTFFDAVKLFALTLIILLILSMQFNTLIRVFGVRLKFYEWFGLTTVNTMANYIFPAKTGSVIRGVYLKKNHSFPFSHYTSLIASSQLVSILVTTISGGIILIGFNNNHELSIGLLMTGVAMILVVSYVLYLIISVLTGKKIFSEKIINFIVMMKNGFSLMGKAVANIQIYCLLAVMILLFWALRLQVCFAALGADIEFSKILLIQIIVNISFIFSLTPGNIGIKEGVTAFAASQMSIDPGVAVMASLIDRTFAMAVVFLAGIIFSRKFIQSYGKL